METNLSPLSPTPPSQAWSFLPFSLSPQLLSLIFGVLITACSGQASNAGQPTQGRVTGMVNGDLMCYVTLVDSQNVSHDLGATFELCENPDQFINQTVQVSYETVAVNDCESAEPCGKTRQALLITKMERISGQ